MMGWKQRLTLLATALLGGIIGGALMMAFAMRYAWAGKSVADNIKARNFALVDQTGKRRAALSVNANGLAALDIYDGAGLSRSQLAVLPDGTSIFAFSDKDGKPVTVLNAAAKAGTVAFAFFNPNGTTRAELALKDGDPAIALSDHSGNRLLRMDMRGNQPTLALYDTRGNWRSLLTLNSDGTPELGFADEEARPRAMLGLQPDGRATFALSSDLGRASALLSQLTDGGSTLELFNQDGTIVSKLP